MKYFKQYEENESQAEEITKDEARHTLYGWWKDEMLNDIFENDIEFRLYTPYCEVWTQTEDGKVPIADFYGTVG